MSINTPHTLAGFKASFFVEHRRQPTEQEIFDAGMRAGRDLKWTTPSRPSAPTIASCGPYNSGNPGDPRPKDPSRL